MEKSSKGQQTSEVKNLFVEEEEARRYHQYRPVYHHLPAAFLAQLWGHKIPRTLDVACGTGHSTQALASISDFVIGCDLSESMLRKAREQSGLRFVQGAAEELPFPDADFDYVNISMAFQWLDQPRFLTEAKRVLKSGGLLGIDNYGFTGRCLEKAEFFEAYRSFDQKYMQAPPRYPNYPKETDLIETGFQAFREHEYKHEVTMTKEEFINYLMTRSNFLELDSSSRNAIENRMHSFYQDLFSNEKLALLFRGHLKLYRSEGTL